MKNFNLNINVMNRRESIAAYSDTTNFEKICDTRNKRKLLDKILSAENGLEMFTELNTKIMTDYNKKLIDDGLFPSEKEVLTRNNIIDVRHYVERPKDLNSMPTIKLSDEDYQFLSENDWTLIIPCFEKGTIILNKYRYIYFELKNINVQNKTITAIIQDFEIVTSKNSSYWEPGIQVEYEIKPDLWINNSRPITILNKKTNFDIYNLIPASEFDWTKDQKIAFDMVQTHAKLVSQAEDSGKIEMSFSNNFVNVFTVICIIVNSALNREKLRTKRKKREKTNDKTNTSSHKPVKKEFEENDEDTIRRLTRYVGKIKIKSQKPPKRPTEETIIKYKVASWPRKGYVRRNKNGTTSVIPPTICNRHGMENNNTKIKQTLIIQKPDED